MFNYFFAASHLCAIVSVILACVERVCNDTYKDKNKNCWKM